MCGGEVSPEPAGLSRRSLLVGGVAAGAALLARSGLVAAAARTTVDLGGVPVIPRAEWGGDLAPTGPIPVEPDVLYLLVHHSVDPGNDYAEADVTGILRGFVRFHTSAAKGWPDLAYNFLVDRFGRVWEGRTGSLAGPVAGDATGGNQGFDQLCCFIGNHQAAEPTPEAFAAMGRLLSALAGRSGIPLGEGTTVTFASRGSNRHPAGTSVTTPTIAGHRDMSRTQCPGDRVVARLPQLRQLAAGGAPARAPATTAAPDTSTTVQPAATAAPTTIATTAAVPTTATPTTGPTTSTAPSAGRRPARPTSAAAETDTGDGVTLGPAAVVAGGAAAAMAAAAGSAWARGRRRPAGPHGASPEDGSGRDPSAG